ncbi:MAG: YqgE/AlgH family protein [Burkholderiales bacterium]|nr:YqgE/AlgH family protein [Burkholderiales bacterium]
MQAKRLTSRILRLLAAAWLAGAGAAFAQSAPPGPEAAGEDAVFLVANRGLRDMVYRRTVLIAVPLRDGAHVGVILNRPTDRPLITLFPEHEPSKQVVDPVHFGGPFARGALVALVKAESSPGAGAVPMLRNLYMAFGARTIDGIIEKSPNEARYYVGYVGWRPGELRAELERGLWTVTGVDREAVFRKGRDMEALWDDLTAQSQRLQALLAPEPALR